MPGVFIRTNFEGEFATGADNLFKNSQQMVFQVFAGSLRNLLRSSTIVRSIAWELIRFHRLQQPSKHTFRSN
jgi:hypothetical protein